MNEEQLADLINSILSDLEKDLKSEEDIYKILEIKLQSIVIEYEKLKNSKTESANGLKKFFISVGKFNVNLFSLFGFLLQDKKTLKNIDKDKLKVLSSCIATLKGVDKTNELDVANKIEKKDGDDEARKELLQNYKRASDENLKLHALISKLNDNFYSLIQELAGYIGEEPTNESEKVLTQTIHDAIINRGEKIEIIWSVDKDIEDDYFEIRKTKMKVDKSIKLPCICSNGKVMLLGLKYEEVKND